MTTLFRQQVVPVGTIICAASRAVSDACQRVECDVLVVGPVNTRWSGKFPDST